MKYQTYERVRNHLTEHLHAEDKQTESQSDRVTPLISVGISRLCVLSTRIAKNLRLGTLHFMEVTAVKIIWMERKSLV